MLGVGWHRTDTDNIGSARGCRFQGLRELAHIPLDFIAGDRFVFGIAPILKPRQHHIDAAFIAGKHAGGIEQLLKDLIVGGERHPERQSQFLHPEIQRILQGFGGERGGDGNGFAGGRFRFPGFLRFIDGDRRAFFEKLHQTQRGIEKCHSPMMEQRGRFRIGDHRGPLCHQGLHRGKEIRNLVTDMVQIDAPVQQRRDAVARHEFHGGTVGDLDETNAGVLLFIEYDIADAGDIMNRLYIVDALADILAGEAAVMKFEPLIRLGIGDDWQFPNRDSGLTEDPAQQEFQTPFEAFDPVFLEKTQVIVEINIDVVLLVELLDGYEKPVPLGVGTICQKGRSSGGAVEIHVVIVFCIGERHIEQSPTVLQGGLSVDFAHGQALVTIVGLQFPADTSG